MANTPFYTPSGVKEKFDERAVSMVTRSLSSAIDAEVKARPGETRSDVIRRALELYYNPQPIEVTEIQQDLESAPLVDARVACGPPEEARNTGTQFVVSKPTADEIGLTEDGMFVRARGWSMECAGILDEYLVFIEPLKSGKQPRRGEKALIQIETEGGEYLSTLKIWAGENNGMPRLTNGDETPFEYPTGTVGARAVGIARGVIGAL